MAQTKKKQATKTAKKTTKKTQQKRTAQAVRARRTQCDNRDRNHIFIVTAMSMITAILLCANAVMLMF